MRNIATSKKIGVDVISENCGVIAFFLIYGQFAVMWKPQSGRMFHISAPRVLKPLFPNFVPEIRYICY